MKRAFNVLAIMRPSEEQRKKGLKDKIISGPEVILSPNAEVAKMEVVQNLQKDIDLSQVEILVSPF